MIESIIYCISNDLFIKSLSVVGKNNESISFLSRSVVVVVVFCYSFTVRVDNENIP